MSEKKKPQPRILDVNGRPVVVGIGEDVPPAQQYITDHPRELTIVIEADLIYDKEGAAVGLDVEMAIGSTLGTEYVERLTLAGLEHALERVRDEGLKQPINDNGPN